MLHLGMIRPTHHNRKITERVPDYFEQSHDFRLICVWLWVIIRDNDSKDR